MAVSCTVRVLININKRFYSISNEMVKMPKYVIIADVGPRHGLLITEDCSYLGEGGKHQQTFRCWNSGN